MMVSNIKPREPLIDSPYKGEQTVCKCGFVLERHLMSVKGTRLTGWSAPGWAAKVTQTFDPDLGRWVETSIHFDVVEYVYTCSACKMAADLCKCNESDIERHDPYDGDLET